MFRPVTPDVLAGDIAHAARRLAAPSSRVRVAIDGAVTADTDGLAELVLGVLGDVGLPAFHVRTDDFLRARSIRFETGADDPDAGYWRWVDHEALRREVLDPFPTGSFLPSLRDARRDRPTRARPVVVPEPAVLVVSGALLLRTELADAYEVRTHLETSSAALRRRVPEADLGRVLGSWEVYQEWDNPAGVAELVVRYDHPDRPALHTSAG